MVGCAGSVPAKKVVHLDRVFRGDWREQFRQAPARHDRLDGYFRRHKSIDATLAYHMRRFEVVHGLSTEEVRLIWGEPNELSLVADGVERWAYWESSRDWRTELYFKEGRVALIKNWSREAL